VRASPLKLILNCVLTLALGAASVVLWVQQPAVVVPAPEVSTPEAQLDGEILFRIKGCSGCHVGPGIGEGVQIGPPLVGLSVVAGQRIEGMTAEAYIRQSLLEPEAFFAPGYGGDIQMPTLSLTEADVDALVIFLLKQP
jgi:hypothetical protein